MQFFKKWANPVLFFIYFRLFRTHYKFYNKYVCEKCPSILQCQDSNSRPLEQESPPMTTRLGLPPIDEQLVNRPLP